eukprot:GHRQ01030732.1.p4 GENE.GHRQ01030732.1~~GHRQ01030732.1.p4  ORF type:complete len:101 (+),score=21.41 GHRQ01030732.1:413-715(+)
MGRPPLRYDSLRSRAYTCCRLPNSLCVAVTGEDGAGGGKAAGCGGEAAVEQSDEGEGRQGGRERTWWTAGAVYCVHCRQQLHTDYRPLVIIKLMLCWNVQ